MSEKKESKKKVTIDESKNTHHTFDKKRPARGPLEYLKLKSSKLYAKLGKVDPDREGIKRKDAKPNIHSVKAEKTIKLKQNTSKVKIKPQAKGPNKQPASRDLLDKKAIEGNKPLVKKAKKSMVKKLTDKLTKNKVVTKALSKVFKGRKKQPSAGHSHS